MTRVKRTITVVLTLLVAWLAASCSPPQEATAATAPQADPHAPRLLLRHGGAAPATAAQEVNANGFVSPLFGLATAPNGDLLVADAGAGIAAFDGSVGTLDMPLPGITDLGPIGRGTAWATTGPMEDPTTDDGQALHRISRGGARQIANLFAFEAAYDPDGAGVDSNPFDVASLGGNAALVTDAGGNDLLRIDNRGRVEVLAIFPDELVSTANLQALIGCPEPPPAVPAELAAICEVPAIPAQAVPTSVAVGPDGHYYVGELKGFPAPTGASNVWRVAPGAAWEACPSPACVKLFDGGFTSIIDLAFGSDGLLYVAELEEQSWFAVEAAFFFGLPIPLLGGTINACDPATLTCVEVATGIPVLTAIAFGSDGALWATENALIPPLADVIAIP